MRVTNSFTYDDHGNPIPLRIVRKRAKKSAPVSALKELRDRFARVKRERDLLIELTRLRVNGDIDFANGLVLIKGEVRRFLPKEEAQTRVKTKTGQARKNRKVKR